MKLFVLIICLLSFGNLIYAMEQLHPLIQFEDQIRREKEECYKDLHVKNSFLDALFKHSLNFQVEGEIEFEDYANTQTRYRYSLQEASNFIKALIVQATNSTEYRITIWGVEIPNVSEYQKLDEGDIAKIQFNRFKKFQIMKPALDERGYAALIEAIQSSRKEESKVKNGNANGVETIEKTVEGFNAIGTKHQMILQGLWNEDINLIIHAYSIPSFFSKESLKEFLSRIWK